MEQRRVELRGMEGKLREAEEESGSGKAKLLSFTKAMGSLQDDRDRVLNMYKQLEEKHLEVKTKRGVGGGSKCLPAYLLKRLVMKIKHFFIVPR